MRRNTFWLTLALLAPLMGCAPELLSPGEGVLSAVAGWSPGDALGDLPAAAASSPISSSAEVVSGSIDGSGNYQLFDLGPASSAEALQVALESGPDYSDRFIVVLFDTDYDLLMRARITARTPLQHVTRAAAPHVYLGVTPSAGSGGGSFRFRVTRAPGATVPPPQPQLVYLNFGAGQDVRVQYREPISFPAFDAAVLGAAYGEHTQLVKDVIVEMVRADYAPYDVVLLSSEDGPPPAGAAISMVHFGGADERLLGLADNVDMYNQEPQQTAVVYVESFTRYQAMQLAPDDVAAMLGNVASHELGHLLGLYHTKDPAEVMDATGSALDLTRDQAFQRAPLEESVFPTGMANAPRLLEYALGRREEPAGESAKPLSAAKLRQRALIRTFTRGELRCRCGLCLNPDE